MQVSRNLNHSVYPAGLSFAATAGNLFAPGRPRTRRTPEPSQDMSGVGIAPGCPTSGTAHPKISRHDQSEQILEKVPRKALHPPARGPGC